MTATAPAAGRRGPAVVAAAVVALWLLASHPALAGGAPDASCVALPSGSAGVCEAPRAADQRLSMDKRRDVMSATAYQSLVVAGMVGGAAAIGALAGGLHAAVLAGSAVYVAYLFIP